MNQGTNNLAGRIEGVVGDDSTLVDFIQVAGKELTWESVYGYHEDVLDATRTKLSRSIFQRMALSLGSCLVSTVFRDSREFRSELQACR